MKNKIAILSLFFLPVYAYTQVNNGFTNKLERYNRSYSSQGLYLHCDKTTYKIGDNIWFTGYQLKNLDTSQTVMFVALQNLSNDSVLSSDRFIMINGISKGNLFLSNKLKQGNYRLTAFTNIQLDYPGKPVFQQLITVIGPQAGEYSLANILTSPIPDRNGNYAITYKLSLRDGGSVNGGKFKYTLLAKGQVIQTGNLPLSELGEVTIPVHKDYGSTSLELAATIVQSKEEQFFVLPLIVQDSLSIGLYPEGGNLIAGQKSKVALEITSNKNETGVIKGQILENGKPITSFNTNKYGLGSFDLEPKFNAIYTVAIKDKPKFSYVFPEVLKQGVTMAVKIIIYQEIQLM